MSTNLISKRVQEQAYNLITLEEAELLYEQGQMLVINNGLVEKLEDIE